MQDEVGWIMQVWVSGGGSCSGRVGHAWVGGCLGLG